MVNEEFYLDKKYKGLRLIAVDGSDTVIPTNKDDYDTHNPRRRFNSGGYNCLHINVSYDILNNRYLNVLIQGVKSQNEKMAMCELVDRYDGDKAIFIADRGYEMYNIFERVRNSDNYFLIRIKDNGSPSSLCSKMNLPDCEFDEIRSFVFTNKQTKLIKENPDKYHYLHHLFTFDYLNKKQECQMK